MSLQNKQAQEKLQEHNDIIRIKVGELIYDGYLRGKKLDWPMIFVPTLNRSIEFAWSTVYTAVQNGIILVA